MNGNIYKITFLGSDEIYVGSTIEPLKTRMANHKTYCKTRYHTNNRLHQLIAEDRYNMELIKTYAVVDLLHLHAIEQLHINKNKNCINHNLSFNIYKKFQNKLKCAERFKKQETIYCDCGGHYVGSNINNHLKTKKHLRHI